MSLSLVSGCIWVLIATIVAFFPMRWQYPPGIALLLIVPFLLGWIAYDHGWWIFALGLAAFISMFRHPLRYLFKRVTGRLPEVT